MNRRLFIAPLGIAVMAAGVGSAQAQVVGDPHQSDVQSSVSNQGLNQNAGGGVVIGDTGQTASNDSTTGLGNFQVLDSGGAVVVGSPGQSSAQSSLTNQGVNQNANSTPGGVTLGDTDQGASNTATTDEFNLQVVAGSPTIVGDPHQSNLQSSVTNQGANQSSGGGVRIGDVNQTQANDSTTNLINLQFAIGGIIVGSPGQASHQAAATNQAGNQNAGGGVVIGDTGQGGTNSQSTTAFNLALII